MNKRTFVRRLLALTTAAVMLLSAVPAMAAFRDTEGHWAEKTITEWQEQGLIDGYGDGGFHPNASVTRAEFVKLLNSALNFTVESAISFTDVKEGDWFYAEAAKAAAAGYAQGSNGAFHPEQAITRAEAAAMIARAVRLTADEKRADAFADAAAIPVWAKGSVGAAAESGYMNGYPDGTFGAGNYITRAEAVVTLDRVRKDAQSVTVEKAGTTLENETVAGNLIIAASVGEGSVTLKNVTVRGDLIVQGGGANSVYLDNTTVSGSVQMQKENVHLRLMGGTTLGGVEISQPCRITRDGSFKGTLGTVVIDLEKASNQEIQIEVPAERVEVLSCANVALNADVEKLILGADAEGAQLEIKRGATVGELTVDAKAKLTGSGTVSSLVVSVSDVTVSNSLSVKKTETTDGAKEPTVSGGSTGSSGRVLKEITGVEPITAEVPYGTSASDALATLPTEITLNVKDGSAVKVTAAGWNWADGVTYNGTTAGKYTAATAFTVPTGYTYSGAKTASAAVTVKALGTSKFNAALMVAEAKQAGFTEKSDVAEATNTDTIYVLPVGTAESAVTNDVKFILAGNAEYTALKTAVTKAASYAAGSEKFDSQTECDALTAELTAAADGIDGLTVMTGKNYTLDYIRARIKNWLDNGKTTQTEWAISDAAWPLKYGHEAYTLPEKTDDMQLSANTTAPVALTWTITGTGWEEYLSIADSSEANGKSVSVIKAPDAPMEITFKVSAAYNGTDYGETGTYTVTIGAPISVSAAQPKDAPRFASGPNATGKIYINLNGVAAITAVDVSKISIRGWTTTEGADYQINDPKTTDGAPSAKGVCLDVSLSSGQLAKAQNFPVSGSTTLMYKTGKVTVTISKGALTLDESKGWYFPNEGLTQDVVIWLVNPQLSVTTQTATDKDPTHRNISVRTKYVGDAPVQVAYTKEITELDSNYRGGYNPNVWVWVEIPSRQAVPSSDGEKIYSDSDVKGFDEAGTYYIWCRAWEGCGGEWLYTGVSFTVGGQSTP